MNITIKKITNTEKNWVLEVVRKWGADYVVSRGRKIYPTEIDAYFATDSDGKKVGLVSYEVIDEQCEIVTLDAFESFKGIGTALVDRVIEIVRKNGCKRVWLVTTNDNLEAIRFYQRRGFTIAAVHNDAIRQSRQLKPSIPEIGRFGIPIRDEIEFEMLLK